MSSSNEFPAGMEGRSRDPDLFMAKQAAINYIFSETKHTFGDTFILLLASQQELMFVLILLIIISLSWGDAVISYDRNGITAKVFFGCGQCPAGTRTRPDPIQFWKSSGSG